VAAGAEGAGRWKRMFKILLYVSGNGTSGHLKGASWRMSWRVLSSSWSPGDRRPRRLICLLAAGGGWTVPGTCATERKATVAVTRTWEADACE
jgi:hypothetical protein